jgi:ribulose-5-phosphate 4-epimerase/fuculose-1-phosphate aldolase
MASTVRTMPARVSAEEWQTRCDLAACYRLVDLFGWSDLVNTRITARVPGQHNQFLINPYGLLFDEVTASSLVKIDAEGNKVESTQSEINSGGFAISSAVHMARPDVSCVLHTHSIASCAISMQRDGLLPLNQHALQVIGDVAYHDYEGTGRDPEERARLLADLGHRHILVLRNHGLLIVGTSIAAAFVATYRMERPARCSWPSSNRAPRSTRSPTRSSAPLVIVPPASVMNQPSSNGRLCCASSTGSTRLTSSSPGRSLRSALRSRWARGRNCHPAPPA